MYPDYVYVCNLPTIKTVEKVINVCTGQLIFVIPPVNAKLSNEIK